jgi:hypothetical protein
MLDQLVEHKHSISICLCSNKTAYVLWEIDNSVPKLASSIYVHGLEAVLRLYPVIKIDDCSRMFCLPRSVYV